MKSTICALVALLSLQSTHAAAAAGKLEIVDIQTSTGGDSFDLTATIHSNATRFDLLLVVHKLMVSHKMLLTLKLKVKPFVRDFYVTVYRVKSINVCEFLASSKQQRVMRHLFKSNLPPHFAVRCPVQSGEYLLQNFGINSSHMQEASLGGTYRLFAEVVQVDEAVKKLLSLQITALYTLDDAAPGAAGAGGGNATGAAAAA